MNEQHNPAPCQELPDRTYWKEIVVDGTDCSGKSPLVECLSNYLKDKGFSVASFAPFSILKPYPKWQHDPVNTAIELKTLVDQFRNEARGSDYIIWDRGWPTVWVDTENVQAKALFPNVVALTVLLLNKTVSVENTVRKYGLTEEHLVDHRQRQLLNARYRLLAASKPNRTILFEPGQSCRFDLLYISKMAHEALHTHPIRPVEFAIKK